MSNRCGPYEFPFCCLHPLTLLHSLSLSTSVWINPFHILLSLRSRVLCGSPLSHPSLAGAHTISGPLLHVYHMPSHSFPDSMPIRLILHFFYPCSFLNILSAVKYSAAWGPCAAPHVPRGKCCPTYKLTPHDSVILSTSSPPSLTPLLPFLQLHAKYFQNILEIRIFCNLIISPNFRLRFPFVKPHHQLLSPLTTTPSVWHSLPQRPTTSLSTLHSIQSQHIPLSIPVNTCVRFFQVRVCWVHIPSCPSPFLHRSDGDAVVHTAHPATPEASYTKQTDYTYPVLCTSSGARVYYT